MTQPMDDAERQRRLLLSLAYRMTGSAGEAEDLAQEAYLRFLTEEPDPEQDRPAVDGLTAILTRLCLDYLASEQVELAHYEGTWLPEPVLTADDALPPLDTPRGRASIALAFLILLAGLEPRERAAYLLRDVFGHADDDVADMLGLGPDDYRRVHERALAGIDAGRPPYEDAPEAQRRLTERLVLACRREDTEAVKGLLAEGVTAWTDGGGTVPAALRPIEGRDAVARYLVGYLRKLPATIGMTYAEVNGGPGLLTAREDTLNGVIALAMAGGAIRGVYLLLNGDKLAFIERQLRESR